MKIKNIKDTAPVKSEQNILLRKELKNWQGRKEWFFNRKYTDTYEQYYEGPYKRAEIEQKHVMTKLLKSDGRLKNMLEYGCGTTRFTRYWHKIGIDAVGADISPFMLAQGIEYFGGDLLMADAHQMPFKNNSFDVVTFMNTFEYYQKPAIVLQEAARVAKHGIALGMMNKITPKFIRRRVQQRFGRNEFYRTATFYTPKSIQKLVKKTLAHRKFNISWKMTGLPAWFPLREWKYAYGDFFGFYIKFEDNLGQ